MICRYKRAIGRALGQAIRQAESVLASSAPLGLDAAHDKPLADPTVFAGHRHPDRTDHERLPTARRKLRRGQGAALRTPRLTHHAGRCPGEIGERLDGETPARGARVVPETRVRPQPGQAKRAQVQGHPKRRHRAWQPSDPPRGAHHLRPQGGYPRGQPANLPAQKHRRPGADVPHDQL